MEEILEPLNEVKDLLVEAFTTDPMVWLKWVIVYATIIISFIISFKILRIIDPYKRLKEKCRIAREKGHIINAKLIEKWYSEIDGVYTGHGIYEYTLNGKTYKYSATFTDCASPKSGFVPSILYLYYKNSPRRVFSEQERYYNLFMGILLVIVKFSPLIVGGLVGYAIGLSP